MVRAAAALVVGLTMLALAGCAHSSGGETVGCLPRRPHVSQDVLRAGDAVTVSVSAATCRPTFDDDRRLSIEWQDQAGHKRRLATTRAFPSGAFEQTVRIPADAPAGSGQLFVIGVEVPCPGNASCAAYEAGLQVVAGAPDFTAPAKANRVASLIADRMQTVLQPRSSLFSVAIVTDGIEVVLHTTKYDRERAAVQRAFAAGQEAVPAAERKVADEARLHVAFVQHSEAALERLTLHIAHDSTWQKQHSVELSEWFPDSATDSVRIELQHYTDAVAIALTKRYGDAVTVSTKDTPIATAD